MNDPIIIRAIAEGWQAKCFHFAETRVPFQVKDFAGTDAEFFGRLSQRFRYEMLNTETAVTFIPRT